MIPADELRRFAAGDPETLPSYTGKALAFELLAARAERDRYHDALVARHGGEPIALLSELDAARAEAERLTKERDAARDALQREIDLRRENEVAADARHTAELDAARAELAQWPNQIAAALSTTAHIEDRSPATWAGHVRREHEAHTACFDRLTKVRAEVERVAKQRDELVAIADRACRWYGSTKGGVITSMESLGMAVSAIAAEQPKPAGGA